MRLLTALCFMMYATVAYAQTIDSSDFGQEGFGGVGNLWDSMTPQQHAAILKQANANMA